MINPPFRQKPLAAFVATLTIIPMAKQETKPKMTEHQDRAEEVETPQAMEHSGLLDLIDWDADGEPPTMPVFGGDVKKEQAELVRIIGRRLAEARELCNLSQSAAAKRLGYSNSSKLSKVEGATDTNSVPLWLILRAAKVYEVSIDYLFGVTDDWETGGSLGEQGFLLDAWDRARRRDLEVLLVLRRRIAEVSKAVPAITQSAEQVVEAVQKFRALNPDFDDMRGGARLVAASEALQQQSRDAARTVARFRTEIGIDQRGVRS